MSDQHDVVTLTTVTDTYHFRIGDVVECALTPSGAVRLATRRERLQRRVTAIWLRWTRWFRPRTVTSAIDRELGAITLVSERWSWRRWRWERS